jgi:hypothetical protein
MVIGTVFTLFVVPVFYGLMAADHAKAPAAATETHSLPLTTGSRELAHA